MKKKKKIIFMTKKERKKNYDIWIFHFCKKIAHSWLFA